MLPYRKYYIVALVIAVFIVGYGFLDRLEKNTASIGGYASAGVQECGCDKCLSVELNGYQGCHKSNNPNRSDEFTEEVDDMESLESDSAEGSSQDDTEIESGPENENENTDSPNSNEEKPRYQNNKK